VQAVSRLPRSLADKLDELATPTSAAGPLATLAGATTAGGAAPALPGAVPADVRAASTTGVGAVHQGRPGGGGFRTVKKALSLALASPFSKPGILLLWAFLAVPVYLAARRRLLIQRRRTA